MIPLEIKSTRRNDQERRFQVVILKILALIVVYPLTVRCVVVVVNRGGVEMTRGKPSNPVWNELFVLEKKLKLSRNAFYDGVNDIIDGVDCRCVKYNQAIALLKESIAEVHSLRQKVRRKKEVSK